jgi:predicted NUDIX family NTP pyrophosphohydrolase
VAVVAKVSAGLLMYRFRAGEMQFLLAHPGGPYFTRRDEGIWTIPKGTVDPGEDPLSAAKREFFEEIGFQPVSDRFEPLGGVRQRSGKIVHAWAFAGDCDPSCVTSNMFEVEWPRRSGRRRMFPEIDRAGFFDAETARRKLVTAQAWFIDRALALAE